MKKIIKSAFFAIILISLASCETENDNPVPVANGITLESISPNGPYVLSAEDGDNDVATLTWTKADNGVPTIPSSYVIEIAKSGTNFADPIVASTSSTDLSYKWTEGYLDPILLDNGFIPDEATAIDIRIKSTLGLGSFPFIQYSNVISTSVTPFAQPSFAFAKEGDNPADAPKM
ncbi:MAG TPA: SusE domain-containing protein, partial [Flavobacterium sp.]|nr:SusE domain-containing protein [Flavobacterium sp.]